MSDTIKIDLVDTSWTNITSLISDGFFTNNSGHSIRYRKSATQPANDDDFGHILQPQKKMHFSLSDGQSIWALGFQDDAKVAVTDTNPIPVKTELNTTAFGDLKAEMMTPVTQISAEYGLLNQVLTVVDAGVSGSTAVVDNKFTCQTGAAVDGVAAILSLRLLSYRPGQGSLARYTAVFTTGVAQSRQLAGLITAENSFAFGYVGTEFGVIHTHNGESEYRELTITTAATGTENATITVDGVAYTVPLTSGTVQHNAFEISNSLNSQVPNYDFSSNNDQVLAQAVLNGASGSFTFSSSTAVAAWVQITIGALPITDFTAQANWSENDFSAITPSFDPTKGNVYQIQIQYLGFGGIKFFVEDPSTANFVLVHIIKYANTATIPSVTNPSFRVGWVARNFGNTTNLTVSGSSAATFIEGKVLVSTPPKADEHDQLGITTTLTNIISFRNRLNFGGKRNRAAVIPLSVSISTQSNKSVFIEILANPSFTGDLDFNYVDKASSIMETAKDSIPVTSGEFIDGRTIVSGASEVIRFNTRDWHNFVQCPGQIFTIAAHISGGAAADVQVVGTWAEDI